MAALKDIYVKYISSPPSVNLLQLYNTREEKRRGERGGEMERKRGREKGRKRER